MAYRLAVEGTFGDILEVRVLKWHRDAGQSFAPDDLLLEVETDKAIVEVRAKAKGVLRRQLVERGAWLQLNAPAAIVTDTEQEAVPADAAGLPSLPTDLRES